MTRSYEITKRKPLHKHTQKLGKKLGKLKKLEQTTRINNKQQKRREREEASGLLLLALGRSIISVAVSLKPVGK